MNKEKLAYELLKQHYQTEHTQNKNRVKYGIFVFLFVPVLFLVLMFMVDSSKIIFLVLWIVSLFVISAYLIAVEYRDYCMWKDLHNLLDLDDEESLVDVPKIITKAEELAMESEDEKTYEQMNSHEKD